MTSKFFDPTRQFSTFDRGMGNKANKQARKKPVEDVSKLIENAEKKLLISWTTEITKKWFDYHLCNYNQHDITKLLLLYAETLCIEYGFDGYGITLMNEAFFVKMSYNIIDQVSRTMDEISDDMINQTKELVKSFWDEHIVRIQEHFNKEFPTTETTLQDEPNMEYLSQIIAENKGNSPYIHCIFTILLIMCKDDNLCLLFIQYFKPVN